MNIHVLSRRDPAHVSILRDILYKQHGHTSYVKYVMRTFHNATIYIRGDDVIGVSVWRVVARDISKECAIERYTHVLVLNTYQGDYNMISAMIRDIEMFSSQRGIPSVLISPRKNEEGFYQYLGFQIVSVFPSVTMRKIVSSDQGF